ncbi:helix-turn-helix transcriptional regulator [Paenibacillus doosanensis]|uniref:helix-turn-helix domain-containing protein n=1 Tax=Paenibacillus doosanensis TaxID=1229154 RepID=UPI00217FBADE|nr:helix-turn-helix transcriptional regulator [Paenibacillus doosanensis]MCS7463713.1 helix-turn-helix transcriptional regulator [Paenibacillus doosanensis]
MEDGSRGENIKKMLELCGSDYESIHDLPIQRVEIAMETLANRYALTKRESEMVTLIAAFGFSNREIAEHCTISEKTVKIHLANAMNKMGIKSMRKLLSLLFRYVLDASL